PRGRGPARGGEGLGLARRLSRHHARPRAGDARARVAPPHPAAPRCRDRGRHDRSDPRERRSDDPRPALMYVTGRLPLLLAAGVVPLVVLGAAGASPWAVLAIWILLVAAVVLIDVLGSPRPDSIEISRDVPARAKLGDAVPTRLQLINTGERTVRARVRDGRQPTAGSTGERYAVTIPARESRTVTVPLAPRRRGELRSEFVAVRTLGPLGFAGRQRALPSLAAIRILPPFRARRHLASRVQRLRELDGSTSLQVRGRGTEFDSLREYVRGDDVRSIDWRATARSTSTMLRTWRPERDRHATIIGGTGRTAAARVGDETRL